MPIYDKKLLVLSFRQPQSGINAEDEMDNTAGVRSSYVISLQDLGISRLIDMAFIHGYYQPTLVLLHEVKQTWTSCVLWLLKYAHCSQTIGICKRYMCSEGCFH